MMALGWVALLIEIKIRITDYRRTRTVEGIRCIYTFRKGLQLRQILNVHT